MAAGQSSSASAFEVEECDICGDLVDRSEFGSRVLQRRSEIFTTTLSPRPDPKRGRRLSDPGRLLLSSLRLGFDGEGDGTPSKEALLSSFPTGRLPDPRLDVIRSLSPSSTVEAAGEEGEAAGLAFLRSSRSRSIHQASSSSPGSLLVPERLANKRLSLPNTASSSVVGAVGIVLPTELGEAMGAVARSEGPPVVRSPPLPQPPSPLLLMGPHGALLAKDAAAFRRRRSISLECSRMEAILEENSLKQSRKYSLPPKSSSAPSTR